MSFKPFKRKDFFTRDDSPRVSIRKHHLGFNGIFVKLAGLQNFDKVQIFIDEENYRIGFKFHRESNADYLKLFSDNPSHKTKATSAVQLVREYPFLKKIAELENRLDRQFVVTKDLQDKNLWVAQLYPTFEKSADSKSELSNTKGIYRYKRSNGEIAYIGRGNILSRFNSPDRENWDFDVIEYSIIEDPAKQAEWEAYWLNKFVEQNGKLPIYNLQKPKISKH
jgi:hypothetical protein